MTLKGLINDTRNNRLPAFCRFCRRVCVVDGRAGALHAILKKIICMWKDSVKHKPNIGDTILVKTFSGQVFYAVYSDEDEFDVHRPDDQTESRLAWYKYSSRTIVKWRYFT